MKNWTLISLLLLSFSAYAYPTDADGNRIISPTCKAKGDVTLFTLKHRDKISEEDALMILERDWNETWAKDESITYATYIDMQRIVRDTYRRDTATEDEIQETTVREILSCEYDGY